MAWSFFAETCDEQVFREVVEPLPVVGLQRQEDFHRVAPALWFRAAVQVSPVTGRRHAGLASLAVAALFLGAIKSHRRSPLP